MGSRAIVMECQYGARRRLANTSSSSTTAASSSSAISSNNFMGILGETKKRKQGEIDENYVECCPARSLLPAFYVFRIRFCMWFLSASSHFYKRSCRSVGRSVTQTFEMFKTADSDVFLHSYHLSCHTTIIFIH